MAIFIFLETYEVKSYFSKLFTKLQKYTSNIFIAAYNVIATMIN